MSRFLPTFQEVSFLASMLFYGMLTGAFFGIMVTGS